MMVAISVATAVVPTLLLVVYFYRQDSAKPEPKGLIIKVFLGGLGCVVPVLFIAIGWEALGSLLLSQLSLPEIPARLATAVLMAFVVAASCEEISKFLFVRLTIYRHQHFDEVMDGIVYTIIASLGFACLENVLFALEMGVMVALVRGLTSVPMHAFASGIMGYYIGQARFAKTKRRERWLLLKGLFAAVMLHGLFDLPSFALPVWGPWPVLGIIPLLIIMFLSLRRRIKRAIAEDVRAGRVPPLGAVQLRANST